MSGLDVRQDGKTTIFTFNRLDRKNAINAEVANALYEEFAKFDASDQRVAIITGAGKHFSGGADLADLPVLWKALPTLGLRTEKPVICAVNGTCAGGAFVMAILSDLCVAAETARFHYPEAQYGLTGGVIASLAGRIPHKFAMEVMLLGRPVPAQRAYEMGFVNEVAPHGGELEAALAMARELEDMAPLVLKTLKRFVNDTLLQSPAEKRARAERELQVITASQDRVEGIAAFLEQRKGTFEGR